MQKVQEIGDVLYLHAKELTIQLLAAQRVLSVAGTGISQIYVQVPPGSPAEVDRLLRQFQGHSGLVKRMRGIQGADVASLGTDKRGGDL